MQLTNTRFHTLFIDRCFPFLLRKSSTKPFVNECSAQKVLYWGWKTVSCKRPCLSAFLAAAPATKKVALKSNCFWLWTIRSLEWLCAPLLMTKRWRTEMFVSSEAERDRHVCTKFRGTVINSVLSQKIEALCFLWGWGRIVLLFRSSAPREREIHYSSLLGLEGRVEGKSELPCCNAYCW